MSQDRQSPEYEAAAEADERDQESADYYRCPECNAVRPDVVEGSTPGFTGAPIYFATYSCCGHQEVDTSADNGEAAR